ncbi:MAG: GGDEF domain-containing protein [Rhizobiaceae bacterium]|nr:GGDEF domain-containing protein [Rhizobiaceae bacterium]
MRFHQAESAFFVFIAVVLAAGVTTLHAYGVLQMLAANPLGDDIAYLARLLFAIGVLLATAIFFGAFFIYPLIRQQVQEEGKLRAMTETLSARSVTLEHAALTDGLTGMQNRRFFDEALREYLAAFGPIERPVGLMIIDLDHFKAINDTHGHDIGDKVLKEVSSCLRELTRYHDVVARLGGEEFAIVAANLNDAGLIAFAERIRKAVSSLVVINGNIRLKVTASVGLAVWDGKESADDLYRRADKRLYQAKGLGRNRVCA